MRRVTRTGVLAVAAVSGAMAVTLPAHADSAANGSAAGSPGLISGNGVQLPVNLPVNLCGNTVNVAGLLNPAAGNTCADKGEAAAPGAHGAASDGGATANGGAQDSPGVLSGNGVQLPVHLPVNVSGNSVNVVGIANPAFGNESVNASGEEPARPVEPAPQPPVRHDNPPSEPQHPGPKPAAHTPAHAPALAAQAKAPEAVSSLARTGADATLPALAGSTAMVLGGAALYRRFRPRTER
ncbi:Small secreted domain [Streptomyces sp. yr375]|uniref:chaplin n=1 Tax=Streptomyces sp. yr375 TaxID=1761906 RepID=UPI0008CE9D30|nr:chaplin [Streptomyces sp. yr375]SES23249.1 Small secreted domain [Streptomyces sp. yr375]